MIQIFLRNRLVFGKLGIFKKFLRLHLRMQHGRKGACSWQTMPGQAVMGKKLQILIMLNLKMFLKKKKDMQLSNGLMLQEASWTQSESFWKIL